MPRRDAWSLVVRTILLLSALGLGLVFLFLIREIVAMVLVAAVVAAGVAPAAYRLNSITIGPRRWHIPTPIGVLLVYIGLFAAIAAVSSIVFPPIIDNIQGLVYNAPTYFQDLERRYEELRLANTWLPAIDFDQSLINQASAQARTAVPTAFNVVFDVVNRVFQAFFILILALYITIEAPHIRNFLLRLLPVHQRSEVVEISNEIAWRTGRWVLGQLILATVVGLAWVIAMLVLQVPYPFAIGFVAFVGELIPMVGPIITGVVAAAIALTTSPLQFGLTIGVSILIQQLENNLLVPRIMNTAVGVSPLTVILALLIGGSLLGFIGAILAVPVAAALQVLVTRLVALRETQLGVNGEDGNQYTTPGAALASGQPDQSSVV